MADLNDILGTPDAAPAPPSKILETVALRFLARVIHADASVNPKELETLLNVATTIEMGEDEARRILEDEFSRKSDCEVLARQIPDEDQRRQIYALGCLVALSEGEVADQERTLLADFARGAEIPPADAMEILDEVLLAARTARDGG
jgi:hypothetical protein